jgi:imidazole glycerol-phosphate synthase subunit HisH
MMISIIDYGAGNIRSIENALKKVGAEVSVGIGIDKKADALVLPGVGHFGDAMGKIGPVKGELIDAINSGKPFLGLCLGLQVLFEGSEEAPGVKGLGILKGSCKRFKETEVPGGKVPHMGWNQARLQSSVLGLQSPLFKGIKTNESFYFVHSYFGPVIKETIGVCNYGIDFSAAVQKKNVFACQFHPERSGEAGLNVLKNFVAEAKK